MREDDISLRPPSLPGNIAGHWTGDSQRGNSPVTDSKYTNKYFFHQSVEGVWLQAVIVFNCVLLIVTSDQALVLQP